MWICRDGIFLLLGYTPAYLWLSGDLVTVFLRRNTAIQPQRHSKKILVVKQREELSYECFREKENRNIVLNSWAVKSKKSAG